MNEKPHRYALGSRRFDLGITLSVIGILATLLLHRINDAQVEIEKVMLTTEVNNIRLGLAEAWLHRAVTNQVVSIETLKDSNPMLLIAEAPLNYMGEASKAPKNNKEIWYFDTKQKRLIYIFSDGQQAKYRLVSTAGKRRVSLMSTGGIDLVMDVIHGSKEK